MAQQDFFDFARIDVGAAGNHHVFRTILECQKPIIVERSHITGVQPAATQGFCRSNRVAPIAGHDGIATHQNFANFAGG